jgi:RNA polymerase sigma-70 factor (ECF subfamily)
MSTPPALRELSDRDVVARARLGREEAYGELLRRYQRPVCKFLSHMVQDQDLAEDLTQETFVKAFRALDTYLPERPFSPWLFKIANNVGMDHFRAMEREDQALEDPLYAITPGTPRATGIEMPTGISDTPTPPPRVDPLEFREALLQGLERVSTQYRRCYVMHELQERPYDEIAEVLGISESTARSYVSRARKQLDRILGPQRGSWEHDSLPRT